MRTPTDINVWRTIFQVVGLIATDLYQGVLRGVISRAADDAVLLLGLVGAFVTSIVYDVAPSVVGVRRARQVRRRVEKRFAVAIAAFVVIQLVAHQLGH
jgi:hypothetical protein